MVPRNKSLLLGYPSVVNPKSPKKSEAEILRTIFLGPRGLSHRPCWARQPNSSTVRHTTPQPQPQHQPPAAQSNALTRFNPVSIPVDSFSFFFCVCRLKRAFIHHLPGISEPICSVLVFCMFFKCFGTTLTHSKAILRWSPLQPRERVRWSVRARSTKTPHTITGEDAFYDRGSTFIPAIFFLNDGVP